MEGRNMQTGELGRDSAQKKLRRRLIRVKEAAEYLNVSTWKIREMAHRGALPYLQEGGGLIMFDERDLDAYIKRNRRLGPNW